MSFVEVKITFNESESNSQSSNTIHVNPSDVNVDETWFVYNKIYAERLSKKKIQLIFDCIKNAAENSGYLIPD